MADNQEDAPLATGNVSGSHEVLIENAGPRGGSNSRALKIAGLTTLACLLLASQVFTAYMVFDQKQQIHTLQRSSERMGKQLTRRPQNVAPARMAMPMNSLPLLMDYTEDDSKSSKTPMVKLQDTAIVSLEKQVMDMMKDVSLPQFNETFLANLKSLKQQINESEWKSFETWMRYWLIFQMAQQKPAGPTPQPASLIQTKCQMEAAPGAGKIGAYKPQCDEKGNYLPIQCWHATGFCWCVDQYGNPIQGTAIRGRPQCQQAPQFRRMMLAPRMMQKTYDVEEDNKN